MAASENGTATAAADAEEGPKKGISVPLGPATVALQNVHMNYKVPSADAAEREKQSRLKRVTGRVAGAGPTVDVHALRGVSFVARSGESIGVIGRNGSGKSTMLRVLAGLEPPSTGTVLASSTPVLIGVNAALMPELSGIQNIRLGLLAMGRTPAQIETLLPGIAQLAGIGRSVYLPMKTYSSGMAARLRFAIAAAADPDILLIDEALATGDAAFRARSEQRMTELRRSAGTVFIVSHNPRTVEKICTRAIWLDHGRVVMDGPAYETARKYRWWTTNISRGHDRKARRILDEALALQYVSEVEILDPPRATSRSPRHARRR